jgi:putative membrane protein
MTQWDVVMEPAEATIAKAWIWHDGGAHFGVPLSNYAGWLLTSWLFYQAFAIYLGRRQDLHAPSAPRERTLRLVAIALYLGSGLTHLTPWLIGQSGEVVDAAGQFWRISDLRAVTVVTMLFTMLSAVKNSKRRIMRGAAARGADRRSVLGRAKIAGTSAVAG